MTGISFRWNNVLILAVIGTTFLAFFPSLLNGFTNWDDPVYLTDNPIVQELTPENIEQIFGTFQIGNYHPFTLFSLAVEHQLVGLAPFIYHLDNLLFHLLNTLLVIVFIRQLTGEFRLALLTGLLFGVHPMHVESVAWISERKDLLYSMFYLLGLIAYLHHIHQQEEKQNSRYLILVLLLFLFSCLSKGMAVTFPLSLVAIDIYRKRALYRSIREKAPFFMMSIGFGITAILAQAHSGAIQTVQLFHAYDRLLIVSYNVFYYLKQFILPLKLSPFHPYPETIPSNWVFYLVVILVLGSSLFLFKRGSENRLFLFGGLFFFGNIILVCQIVPLGSAIVAERYSYLAYLGLCLVASHLALGLFDYFDQNRRYLKKWILSGLGVAILLLLSAATYRQCHVWHDSVGLWNQALNYYPSSSQALESRGKVFLALADYKLAKIDFEEALISNPNSSSILNNLGVVLSKLDQFDTAIDYFSKSIRMKSIVFNPFLGRGHAYFSLGENELALNDFDRCILLANTNPDGHANKGAVLMELNREQFGLRSLNEALTIKPSHELALLTRANYYTEVGNFSKAIYDFETLLVVSPNHAEALNNLGFIYAIQGNYTKAIHYFSFALTSQPNYPMALKNRGLAFLNTKEYIQAIADFDSAHKLGGENSAVYYHRSEAYNGLGDFKMALSDALNAVRLGEDVEQEYLLQLKEQQ